MVSMGFLEPSTGRAGRAKREPPQFNSLTAGEENCWEETSIPSNIPPPTSSQFKKACGKHARAPFSTSPRPARDTPTTILASYAARRHLGSDRPRRNRGRWGCGERERMREWLRGREREREIESCFGVRATAHRGRGI